MQTTCFQAPGSTDPQQVVAQVVESAMGGLDPVRGFLTQRMMGDMERAEWMRQAVSGHP
jgi:hypothetical protein